MQNQSINKCLYSDRAELEEITKSNESMILPKGLIKEDENFKVLRPVSIVLDEESHLTILKFSITRVCDLSLFYVDKDQEGIVKAELVIDNQVLSVAIKSHNGVLDFFGEEKLLHDFMLCYSTIYIYVYISGRLNSSNFVLKRETYFLDMNFIYQYINRGVVQSIIRGYEISPNSERPKRIEFIPCIITYHNGILTWKDLSKESSETEK